MLQPDDVYIVNDENMERIFNKLLVNKIIKWGIDVENNEFKNFSLMLISIESNFPQKGAVALSSLLFLMLKHTEKLFDKAAAVDDCRSHMEARVREAEKILNLRINLDSDLEISAVERLKHRICQIALKVGWAKEAAIRFSSASPSESSRSKLVH